MVAQEAADRTTLARAVRTPDRGPGMPAASKTATTGTTPTFDDRGFSADRAPKDPSDRNAQAMEQGRFGAHDAARNGEDGEPKVRGGLASEETRDPIRGHGAPGKTATSAASARVRPPARRPESEDAAP